MQRFGLGTAISAVFSFGSGRGPAVHSADIFTAHCSLAALFSAALGARITSRSNSTTEQCDIEFISFHGRSSKSAIFEVLAASSMIEYDLCSAILAPPPSEAKIVALANVRRQRPQIPGNECIR